MDRILLRGGLVLSMDAEAASADVLIEDGRIAAVAAGLAVGDAERYDCTGAIVLPGFVDSHRHLWQSALRGVGADMSLGRYFEVFLGKIGPAQRPDEVELGTLLGAVEALDAGVTTVFDWCNAVNGAEHADAALGALRRSGIRARFGHGDPGDAEAIRRLAAAMPAGLVDLALAILGPAYVSLEESAEHIALGRELGLCVSLHVGSGLRGFTQRAVARLQEAELLGPDLLFVHANNTPQDELAAIAASGASLSVTPVIESLMGLGAPPFGRYARAGGEPALGTDVAVAASADLFAQMRAALTIERLLSNQRLLDSGEDPVTVEPAAADLLRAATIGGAQAVGLADRIGSITPGKRADIVVLRAPDAARHPAPADLVVTALGPADVDAVLVDGRFVKRAGRLLDHDLPGLRARAGDVVARSQLTRPLPGEPGDRAGA